MHLRTKESFSILVNKFSTVHYHFEDQSMNDQKGKSHSVSVRISRLHTKVLLDETNDLLVYVNTT